MKKRGKVLRDTNTGPGLLVIEGTQYPFALEGTWRSDVPPRPGMAVDAELDHSGSLQAVWTVSDSQLATEQAGQALEDVKRQGGALAQSTLSRFGVSTLVAFAALAAGWFLLTAISIGTGTEGMDISFWQLLGFVNDSHAIGNLAATAAGLAPAKGIYGILGLIALAGPLLRFFWTDKRAALAGLLPILFMLLALVVLRQHITQAAGVADNAFGRMAAERLMRTIMQQVSFGTGAYVSLASALYFAFVGAKKFLVGV